MADGGIGFILGAFEGEEHVTSDRKGIVEGFEAGGKGGPLGVAEIAGDTAEGQDEVGESEGGEPAPEGPDPPTAEGGGMERPQRPAGAFAG